MGTKLLRHILYHYVYVYIISVTLGPSNGVRKLHKPRVYLAHDGWQIVIMLVGKESTTPSGEQSLHLTIPCLFLTWYDNILVGASLHGNVATGVVDSNPTEDALMAFDTLTPKHVHRCILSYISVKYNLFLIFRFRCIANIYTKLWWL